MAQKTEYGRWVPMCFHVQGIGDIEFEARITSIGNDGIGPYEYWGYKGFDHGQDYVEDFEIQNIKLDGEAPTEEKKAEIENAIYEDGRICDEVRKALEEKFDEETEDGREREDR